MNSYDYDEATSRNIGFIIDKTNQQKLKSSVVSIAGVGGVGGFQAEALARLGVGELRIADPGYFDPPDLNRQRFANIDSMGKNKAIVAGEELKKINPELKIKIYSEENYSFDEFLEGADLAIDAIEYFNFEQKMDFFKIARQKGLFVLSSPIPIASATLLVFDPKGMTAEEYFMAPKSRSDWENHNISFDRIYPMETSSHENDIITEFLEGIRSLSTISPAAMISGGLLSYEVINILTKKQKLVIVPLVKNIDLESGKFKVYDNSP